MVAIGQDSIYKSSQLSVVKKYSVQRKKKRRVRYLQLSSRRLLVAAEPRKRWRQDDRV